MKKITQPHGQSRILSWGGIVEGLAPPPTPNLVYISPEVKRKKFQEKYVKEG